MAQIYSLTNAEKKVPSIRDRDGMNGSQEAVAFFLPMGPKGVIAPGRCATCGMGYRPNGKEVKDHSGCAPPKLGWIAQAQASGNKTSRTPRKTTAEKAAASIAAGTVHWVSDIQGQLYRFGSPAASIVGIAGRGLTPLDPEHLFVITEEEEDEEQVDEVLIQESGASSVREDTPTEVDGESPPPQHSHDAPSPPWADFLPGFTPELSPTTGLPREDTMPELARAIKQEELEGDTLLGFSTIAASFYSRGMIDSRTHYPSHAELSARASSSSPLGFAGFTDTVPERLQSEPPNGRPSAASGWRYLSVPLDLDSLRAATPEVDMEI